MNQMAINGKNQDVNGAILQDDGIYITILLNQPINHLIQLSINQLPKKCLDKPASFKGSCGYWSYST
jgi:hypothetical protein